jgi:translation initiation factor 2B subunit (eIF-2B alpha/beta/delta family)
MTPEDFKKGIDSKLLGQVNLVLIGQHYINPKGFVYAYLGYFG